MIQGNQNDFLPLACLGSDLVSNGTSAIVASLRSFVHSPIFIKRKDQYQYHVDVELYGAIIHLMERLLKALVNVYAECSNGLSSHKFDVTLQDLSACDTQIPNSCPSGSNKSRIMDMELDVNEDSRDVDVLAAGGKIAGGVSSSVEKWKLGMISLMSNFFSVLKVTWDVLFELLSRESDQMVYYTLLFSTYVSYCEIHACNNSIPFDSFFLISTQVREKILLSLCQHPYWSSPENVTDMVINDSSEF